MPFEKGKSGNPGGRPKHKMFREALEMELREIGPDHKALRDMARKAIDRARKGDMGAIGFIADRLDGKPAQAIENADPDAPFRMVSRIERVIVKAGEGAEPAAADDEGEET